MHSLPSQAGCFSGPRRRIYGEDVRARLEIGAKVSATAYLRGHGSEELLY